MKSRIHLLPETLTHRIAAGEVVERPASIVKELVENAVDAGATEITVELEQGGCGLIRVTDNGGGINAEDVSLAFARHATSKISEFDDLYRVRSFGFRGEALASIASISRTELVSRTPDVLAGVRIIVEAGEILEITEAGCPVGTTVTVSRIFDSVPVRKKFLKAETTERAYCLDVITRMALANSDVRIRVLAKGRELFSYPATHRLAERIALVLGSGDADRMQPIESSRDGLRIYGFASRPDFTCATTRQIYAFVNRRYVKDYLLNHAVMTAYRRVIEPRRYPAVVLYVDPDPADVDVNVHPAKLEVRFRQPRLVYETIVEALSSMLRDVGPFSSGLLPAGPVGTETKPFSNEEYSSRVSEALKRYSLASGSRKLMFGSRAEVSTGIGSGTRSEIPMTSPTGQPGPGREGSPALDLFESAPAPHRASSSPVFTDLLYAGSLWDTYLIFPSPEGMILIDQHAAHERVLFEKIKNGAHSGKPVIQGLLLPEVLSLAKPDFERLSDLIPLLEQTGIEVEPFGSDAVIVKALPALLAHLEVGSLVRDLISDFTEKEGALSLEEKRDKIYAFLACRGAVKAGKQLTREEVVQLCRDLDATPFAATCPHGRPVYVLYPQREIERMFKRR
ncbi:DNA mismatch repair protein MutL [Syntrophus gentianae]|uniref:DNA mismatch repair protein MutL n=1 Tax=Syntrophus gentianae TaxID=43775 RepID=A0A1H7ZCX8_9BACT|nr:DNA mismatch repair endonuclease MutL [Syntrophus gentianae]SEM56113.1 DNA mismatch repair protein MutL [Syntrophus gentianae]